MSLSALAKRLADAGTPIEAIIMALEAVEAEQARAAEGRAKTAERKRRQRARERDEDVTVTGQSQDSTAPAPFPAPPNENNLTPPTHTPENNTPRAKADPFPRPVGIEPALWADFLKCRKAKRLTNTGTAYSGFLADLADLSARTGWPPGRVLAACVKKGWGAIYETDEMKEITGGKPKQRNGSASTIDAVQRAIELTGGPPGCDPVGSGHGDQRIGQVPDPVRAIGYVER